MLRMIRTATLAAVMLAAACKVSDKPAQPAPEAAHAAKPAGTATPAGHAGPTPGLPGKPESSPPDPELETKGLAMMQRLADVIVADANDCDKLAADLKTFVAQNKPLLSEVIAAQAQEGAGQRAGFSQRNAAAQVAIAQKMQTAMAGCAGHPGILAALQQLPGE